MSNLVKHQTITLTTPDTQAAISGFIHKLTEKSAEVAFVENEQIRTYKTNPQWGPDRLLAALKARPHEGTPIHPLLSEHIKNTTKPATAKKGDVVSFEYEGKTHTGRVLKGGGRATVSLNKSELLHTPANLLKPADLYQPHPELKEWSVSKWTDKGLGPDGYRSEAIITRNGKPTLIVTENGDGAPAEIRPYNRKRSQGDDEHDLTEALRSVGRKAKVDESKIQIWCTPSLWADYAWRIQPTGTTFLDYISS